MSTRNRVPHTVVLLVCLLFALAIAPRLRELSAQDTTPSETPTETATETPTAYATATLTETPTPVPTETSTLTESSTETATETATETSTETVTIVATETPTLEGVEASSPTATLIETPTETATSDLFSPSPSPTLTASATLPALPTEPPLTELFTDNFDTGALYFWTLGEGWSLVPSEGGQALQAANSDEPLTFVHNTLTDVLVEAKFLFDSGIARLDVRKSENGSYNVRLDADGNVNLYRNDESLGSAVVSANVSGQWRTIRLSAVGDIVRAAIDGQEVIAVQDDAPLSQGTISFSAENAPAFTVDDIKAEVPSVSPVVPTEAAIEANSMQLQPQTFDLSALAAYSDVFTDNDAITYVSGTNSTSLGIYSAYNNGSNVSISHNPLQTAANTLADKQNFAPDWSPDGSKFAFQCQLRTGGLDVCIATVNSAGTPTNVITLGVNGSGNTVPIWSPDGQWIAYYAVRASGGQGIWARNVNNPSTEITIINDSKLNPATYAGYNILDSPDWAQDSQGSWIYFSIGYGFTRYTSGGSAALKGIYKISFQAAQGNNFAITKVISLADLQLGLPTSSWYWVPYSPSVNQQGEVAFVGTNFFSPDYIDAVVLYRPATAMFKLASTYADSPEWSPSGLRLAYMNIHSLSSPTIMISTNPWFIPLPPPTPTPTPTPIPHTVVSLNPPLLTTGQNHKFDWARPIFAQTSCQASAMGVQTQATIDRCQIIANLAAFQVVPVNVNTWTDTQLTDLQTAVVNTATALQHFADDNTGNTDTRTLEQVFIAAMLDAPTSQIEVAIDSGAVNCTTNPDTAAPVFARITCYNGVNAFVFVHELGHVFSKHTGRQVSGLKTFFGLVEFPAPNGAYGNGLWRRLIADNGANLIGEFSWSLTAVPQTPPPPAASLPDWSRGKAGWGSGADLLSPPKYPNDVIPPVSGGQIAPPTNTWKGPCSDKTNSANGLPTTFQQNPCYLRNWVVQSVLHHENYYQPQPADLQNLTDVDLNNLGLKEIEEAGADMFLNWVAKRTGMVDANGHTGFENFDWSSATSTPVPALDTGDTRNEWMECAMTVLFNQHGYWQSGIVALPSNCSVDFPGLPATPVP